MAKKSRRDPRHKKPSGVISSEADLHLEATLGPDTAEESTTTRWMGNESTNAPEVGETEEEQVGYAKGTAELFEKFLHGRIPLTPRSIVLVLMIGWIFFVSWLYLQDNQANRLADLGGIKWFGVKAGLYSGGFFVVSVIVFIVARIVKK